MRILLAYTVFVIFTIATKVDGKGHKNSRMDISIM